MPWQLRVREVRGSAGGFPNPNRRVDKATRRAAARAGLAPRQIPPARHRRLPLHGRQGSNPRNKLRGDGGGGAPPPDGVLVRVVRGGGRGNLLPPAPLHQPSAARVTRRVLGPVLRPGDPDVGEDARDQQGREIFRRPLQTAEGVR